MNQQRSRRFRAAQEAEEREQRRLEQAYPTMSKLAFSQPLKEVVHALSVHGVATEGDLKYVEDHSLDQLFTTQRAPLAQGDKSKIRELRLRLVEEEEERMRAEEKSSREGEGRRRWRRQQERRRRRRGGRSSRRGEACHQKVASSSSYLQP